MDTPQETQHPTPPTPAVPISPAPTFDGKIGGWLIVYGIRLVLTPLAIIYDLATTNNLTDEIDPSSKVFTDFTNYLTVAHVIDYVMLVTAVAALTFFFMRKKAARFVLPAVEGFYGVAYAGSAVWLVSILSSYGVSNPLAVVTGSWETALFAALWMVYLIVSKRVKATFVK